MSLQSMEGATDPDQLIINSDPGEVLSRIVP